MCVAKIVPYARKLNLGINLINFEISANAILIVFTRISI